jgi:hypothetical protein
LEEEDEGAAVFDFAFEGGRLGFFEEAFVDFGALGVFLGATLRLELLVAGGAGVGELLVCYQEED